MSESTYLVITGIRRAARAGFECRISAFAEMDDARQGFGALRAQHFGPDDWGSLLEVEQPDVVKIVCWFGACPSVRRGDIDPDVVALHEESSRRPTKRGAPRKRRQ